MNVMLPAAVELSGRWGDLIVLVLQTAVRLARRPSWARITMANLQIAGNGESAQYMIQYCSQERDDVSGALLRCRKHLRNSLHNRDDIMEDDNDDTYMQEL